MRRDSRDFPPAWPRTGSLLAAGPWLRRAESAAERADCHTGSWIRKPERRLHLARKPADVAINCEASVIIFHDGWYYLLVTDRACSAGAKSDCNIRIGRSRKVTGPFVDNLGIEMLADAGKLSGRPSGRQIGSDHFGLRDLGGLRNVSYYPHADLARGCGSVLDIRPLLRPSPRLQRH